MQESHSVKAEYAAYGSLLEAVLFYGGVSMVDKWENENCIRALNTLQIDLSEVSQENIKKAYYRLCRQYHPDQYSHADIQMSNEIQQRYIQIQNAYKLLTKYGIDRVKKNVFDYNLQYQKAINQENILYKQGAIQREAKIISSNKESSRRNKLQKTFQEDKRKASTIYKKKTAPKENTKSKNSTVYEETLQKISAIWIAELIHKQMEEDKKRKEKENRNKLYRAFMQYQENERKNNS